MKIEIGESLLLSWLKHIKECQLVQTNWKVIDFLKRGIGDSSQCVKGLPECLLGDFVVI